MAVEASSVRRLLDILAAVSVLLGLLAACGLWLFADTYVFMATAGGEHWAIGASCHDGGLFFDVSTCDDLTYSWKPGFRALAYDLSGYGGPPRTPDELSVTYRPRVYDSWLGFGFQPDHDLGYVRSWIVRVPQAAVPLLLLAGPVVLIAARAAQRRRMRARGFQVIVRAGR